MPEEVPKLLPPPITKQEVEKPILTRHKRDFSDYFFEFFMLFLAVTLGFIVENWRENIGNHQMEKQYMQSYLEDLENDKTNIRTSINQNQYLIRGLDSLTSAIYNYYPGDQASLWKFYDLYMKYGRSTYLVALTDRTITQLKSSGNLRLVNQKVSDSIMNYDQFADQYPKIQERAYREAWQRAIDFSTSIFDYRYVRYNINGSTAYLNPINGEYRLLTEDVTTLSKYANLIELWRQIAYGYILDLQYQRDKAVRLISYLEKHYDLETE